MKTLVIHQHAHPGLVLKVRIWIPVSLFGTALLSLSLLAETSERDLSELSLDELLETKVQTVTAAAKRTQSVSDAPSAVSVITNDEIRKSGYQNLGEVLANTRNGKDFNGAEAAFTTGSLETYMSRFAQTRNIEWIERPSTESK